MMKQNFIAHGKAEFLINHKSKRNNFAFSFFSTQDEEVAQMDFAQLMTEETLAIK